MRFLIIFLLLTGTAFANCTAHIEHETDIAIFHSNTEATEFAGLKGGQVIISQDEQTFTVLYPVTVVVSNIPDDCGGNDASL